MVSDKNGVVWLTGKVRTKEARTLARNTEHVTAVHNHLGKEGRLIF